MSVLPKAILRKHLDLLRQEIIRAQQSLGIRDTGFSADNIQILGSRKLNAVLTAPRYLETNVDGIGRRPGKMPPVQQILNWGKLDPLVGQTRLQAAFAVAKTIAEFGTRIYQGRQGIPLDEIIEKNTNALIADLADNEVDRGLDAIDKIRFQ